MRIDRTGTSHADSRTRVPETYVSGERVSLTRLRQLATKYSLPTRPYPPLSVKAGESFTVRLPSSVSAARVNELNAKSPFTVSVLTKQAGTSREHLEVRFEAKKPMSASLSPLDVVSLVTVSNGQSNSLMLGIVAVERPPHGS